MIIAKMIVLLFALGMFYVSLKMLINPIKFALAIRKFADWRYFHPFEIGTRFIAALGFYFSHSSSSYPNLYLFMSGLLLFTTIFLLGIGKQRHQAFANYVATHLKPFLRPAAPLSIIFSIFLVYTLYASINFTA